MLPIASTKPSGLDARERQCFNCTGSMVFQGVRNGLYVYFCAECGNSFEVYEPK